MKKMSLALCASMLAACSSLSLPKNTIDNELIGQWQCESIMPSGLNTTARQFSLQVQHYADGTLTSSQQLEILLPEKPSPLILRYQINIKGQWQVKGRRYEVVATAGQVQAQHPASTLEAINRSATLKEKIANVYHPNSFPDHLPTMMITHLDEQHLKMVQPLGKMGEIKVTCQKIYALNQ